MAATTTAAGGGSRDQLEALPRCAGVFQVDGGRIHAPRHGSERVQPYRMAESG